jgi:hypothetical protein
MKLPTIVVFNMYNSYNDFGLESLKVLAVALPWLWSWLPWS